MEERTVPQQQRGQPVKFRKKSRHLWISGLQVFCLIDRLLKLSCRVNAIGGDTRQKIFKKI